MNKIFLITRPNHEVTVSYLHEWGKEVIDFAENENINFSDFSGKEANRENAEKFLESKNPMFVFLNGHGSPSCICGQNNEVIIEADVNDSLLSSKITYAVSCHAAAELGKKIEKNGGVFIGYEGPFGFVRDTNREATPLKDKLAEPFRVTSNSIPLAILKGKTTTKACEIFKRKTLEMIIKHSGSEVEPGYKEIKFWLFWNMRFQKCLGDPDARF